ncbi:unnamed protein product [Spirodela intermedia]|uniref:Uncharacterized protein n=1 Tax=Spirodela intermedia TaxID=51605 RepID=A0A7I8IPY7_SPIIN|nr:unnamed protein product [Spirodela intermedia]CAA6659202.1 unnamed protein product [Spirodela intermedia]
MFAHRTQLATTRGAGMTANENYRAKISDFGASCFAPVDETEIATVVQGPAGTSIPSTSRPTNSARKAMCTASGWSSLSF